ncbi:hypothetical protein [uncultured Microscilla sp.]|uniref:hypothetical protein n=1 Tax=uncultured Microscilla sp. TaxID=432653 RepID=UPI00261032E8|nr:hypothetical protein [uncultured Microscilla sp.]
MSVQEIFFKRSVQLLVTLSLMAGGWFSGIAQEDNRTLKNPNRSRFRTKVKKQNHRKATNYTGNIRVSKSRRNKRSLAIHRLKARGKNNPKKFSQFTGNYTVRKSSRKKMSARSKRLSGVMSYRAKRSSIVSRRGNASSFRGRMRYVNVKAHRARKARKISSFMGKTTHRLRRRGPHTPRSSSVTSYRAPRSRSFRRTANYSKRRLKRGFSRRNANPPAYKRNRSNKLQYNSRETKWMMPKPRKVDKKRSKGSDDE